MSKQLIDVPSEQEIEKISYEVSFLVSRGWKRVWSYDVPSIKKLDEEISRTDSHLKVQDYVWVKPGLTRECWYSEVIFVWGDSHNKITVDWFDRESAYELENES